MLPNNLNLSIGKTTGCNKKVLCSKINMKIGSNKNINKNEVYHKKSAKAQFSGAPETHLMKRSDKSIKYAKTIVPIEYQKMLP